MLTLPDFNRLKVFYYVYQSKSIQRAADDLHVTRSAISQAIKALEFELGAELFVRTNKAILPTQNADKLAGTISPFIRNLTEDMNFIQKGKNEPHGVLKIGAPVEFGSDLLIEELAKFKKKYPTTSFHIELGIPPKILSKIASNELDFGYVDNGDQFEGQFPVVMKTVWSEKFVLVASRKYFKRRLNGIINQENLLKCEFIAYVDHGPVLKMWFKHHFKKYPSKFNTSLVVENVHGIINAVRLDLGLGIVPEYLVEDKLRSGAFVKISVKKNEFENKLMLAQLPDKKPSLTERTFHSFVKFEN